MSELFKKVNLEESKKFYDETYLKFANLEAVIEKLPEDISKHLNDPLYKKQYEYKMLLSSFVEVINERKLNRDVILQSLNIPEESYNMVMNSYHNGKAQSPVTLSTPQVYKMASFVLKDRIVRKLEVQGYEDKALLINDLITEEKSKIKKDFSIQVRTIQPKPKDTPSNNSSTLKP